MTIGINLSGAEFGNSAASIYNKTYAYPGVKDLAYYRAKGVTLVRLPFKWERMQPTLGAPLSASELGYMRKFLTDAHAHGMRVIIDCHNYGRRSGKVIDAASPFLEFWHLLATALQSHPGLAGYDLMNEPHDQPDFAPMQQFAINAIRVVDWETPIYIEGNAWAGAYDWTKNNPMLPLEDPANRLVYEAHIYFDKDNSGTYKQPFEETNHGLVRFKPFAAWLKTHNVKGFIGEFGVPKDDPRWQKHLGDLCAAMTTAGVDGALWGGGAWWKPDYMMNLRDHPSLATALGYN